MPSASPVKVPSRAPIVLDSLRAGDTSRPIGFRGRGLEILTENAFGITFRDGLPVEKKEEISQGFGKTRRKKRRKKKKKKKKRRKKKKKKKERNFPGIPSSGYLASLLYGLRIAETNCTGPSPITLRSWLMPAGMRMRSPSVRW
ncbi:MAG: hypothetical protein O2857_06125 [Planctomycetota bacterium]|nr:hypothetical protein [Planctomycetota bacterium]